MSRTIPCSDAIAQSRRLKRVGAVFTTEQMCSLFQAMAATREFQPKFASDFVAHLESADPPAATLIARESSTRHSQTLVDGVLWGGTRGVGAITLGSFGYNLLKDPGEDVDVTTAPAEDGFSFDSTTHASLLAAGAVTGAVWGVGRQVFVQHSRDPPLFTATATLIFVALCAHMTGVDPTVATWPRLVVEYLECEAHVQEFAPLYAELFEAVVHESTAAVKVWLPQASVDLLAQEPPYTWLEDPDAFPLFYEDGTLVVEVPRRDGVFAPAALS